MQCRERLESRYKTTPLQSFIHPCFKEIVVLAHNGPWKDSQPAAQYAIRPTGEGASRAKVCSTL